MFDDNEDNVVLKPRETLHTYKYGYRYSKPSGEYYIVYNAVDLTVSVYKDEFKYSCYLFNTTKQGIRTISQPEHWLLTKYVIEVFEKHQ